MMIKEPLNDTSSFNISTQFIIRQTQTSNLALSFILVSHRKGFSIIYTDKFVVNQPMNSNFYHTQKKTNKRQEQYNHQNLFSPEGR